MNAQEPLIFWEKQESALCAVHALNNLLQGPYITEFVLAEIAQDLDAKERKLMSSQGLTTDAYLNFAANDSSNVDASGNFSIEVIKQALINMGLHECNNVTSQQLLDSKLHESKGFILNYSDHWFTVLNIKGHFFNLNSLSKHGPEHISEFYLSAYLNQLVSEGYSIYRVDGMFPQFQQLDQANLGRRATYFKLHDVINRKRTQASSIKPRTKMTYEAKQLQHAVAASLADFSANAVEAIDLTSTENTAEDAIQRAIALSLQDSASSQIQQPSVSATRADEEEDEDESMDFEDDDDDDDAELAAALALSQQLNN
jgi:ataxin-3